MYKSPYHGTLNRHNQKNMTDAMTRVSVIKEFFQLFFKPCSSYTDTLDSPHDDEHCALWVTSCLLCRVLDAVDAADHLLLLLRFPPPPHQAEDTAGAETAGDQSDRLQRGLHLPILHAGPQYVCSNSLLSALETL